MLHHFHNLLFRLNRIPQRRRCTIAMARNFTDGDRGSAVFNHQGERVGTVSDAQDGIAHVDTTDSDSGVLDSIKNALGWNDDDDDTYELRNNDVDSIDDEGVHLRQL